MLVDLAPARAQRMAAVMQLPVLTTTAVPGSIYYRSIVGISHSGASFHSFIT